MMMLVAPWRLMSSSASCIDPSPKDISAITEQVPMMMPSTERNDRSLCSHRLLTASETLRRSLAVVAASGRCPVRLAASTATAATPTTAPTSASSMSGPDVEKELITASPKPCPRRPAGRPSRLRPLPHRAGSVAHLQDGAGVVAHVRLDAAVAQPHDAAGPRGDVVLVRHHDDRLA